MIAEVTEAYDVISLYTIAQKKEIVLRCGEMCNTKKKKKINNLFCKYGPVMILIICK